MEPTTPPEPPVCARCRKDDGPFVPRPPGADDDWCEHCAAPVPLDRLEPATP